MYLVPMSARYQWSRDGAACTCLEIESVLTKPVKLGRQQGISRLHAQDSRTNSLHLEKKFVTWNHMFSAYDAQLLVRCQGPW